MWRYTKVLGIKWMDMSGNDETCSLQRTVMRRWDVATLGMHPGFDGRGYRLQGTAVIRTH